MKKDLVLLCDCYPYAYGEFFLDDEIVYLSEIFENIYVVTLSERTETRRLIPNNVTIIKYVEMSRSNNFVLLLQSCKYFFTSFFLNELIGLRKKDFPSLSLDVLKIMVGEILNSKKYSKFLVSLIRQKHINLNRTVFYSYWLDYKSLSLALLHKQFPEIKSVSRAHRWEFMYDGVKQHYLPFREYIINTLNSTHIISDLSKEYLNNRYVIKRNQLVVSRLGKSNNLFSKDKIRTNKYVICSCSSLITLKRVDLIVQLISQLNLTDVLWVHFGDGPEKTKVEKLVKEKLSQIQVLLKGAVANSEIMNYYNTYEIDLFVNLSTIEGVPVSIMEAQSSGIPVLATDVGSSKEIVDDENGFLIPKDFEMNTTVIRIRDYLLSDENCTLKKRNKSYSNWSQRYNAEFNYRKFANDILYL